MSKHIGSTLDDFLKEEGLFEETEAKAIKTVITMMINRELKEQHTTKAELARKMRTSRAALSRLLDSKNTSVTLNSIVKVMRALGKRLYVSIV